MTPDQGMTMRIWRGRDTERNVTLDIEMISPWIRQECWELEGSFGGRGAVLAVQRKHRLRREFPKYLRLTSFGNLS